MFDPAHVVIWHSGIPQISFRKLEVGEIDLKIKFIQPAHLDMLLLLASSSHIRYTVRCSRRILLDNSNSVKQYATTTVVVDVQCPQCTYSA